MPDTPKIKVAIVGGGIAGLTLATGLLKYPHLDVDIYESVPQYSNVGAGMALHANAIRAMELIDPNIKTAYLRAANDMLADDEVEMATQVIMAEGKHIGETIAQLGRAKGRKTIARSDLLEAFSQLVDLSKLHFGKRLANIDESTEKVKLTFGDGGTAEADALIGCDGIHSIVRTYLLGADHPSVNPVNHDGWYRLQKEIPIEQVKQTLSDKYLHTVPILCGPQGYFNLMPLHYGKTLSVNLVRMAKSKADFGTLPTLDKFDGYDPEVRKMVQLLMDHKESLDVWNIQDHDPAPYYAKGRVVMIGDAAHATTPFIGNGAAQAIEDAAVLDCVLQRVQSDKQVLAALQAFDETRRGRSQKVVNLARSFGRLYLYDFEDGMRPDGDIDVFKARLRELGSYTNDADLSQQNQQAIDAFERLTADPV